MNTALPSLNRNQNKVITKKNYRTILKDEFAKRIKRNPRYSSRAFARDLGISASRLSEILSGRYGLSSIAAAEIAERLKFDTRDTEIFCTMVEAAHGRSKVQKEMATERLKDLFDHQSFTSITLDSFQVVSDWHHFAILEALPITKDLAGFLKLSPEIIESSLQRLLRVGLIELKDGEYKATEDFTATPSEVPSDVIKRFHRQVLEKAIQSLSDHHIEKRDFSSMIMAVDHERLPEVKEQLKDFRRKFTADISKTHQANSVYCLSMQFFELGKDENNQ